MSFLASSLAPTATVLPYAAASAPSGWLLCDGSAISRTTYASLFAIIGTSHGSGDGSTTFNIPDYRGRFLRGVDSGAGRDPDSGSASSTVTITIAAPGVVTHTSHGFATNDPVIFSTTGALPTGITAGTTYYVIVVNSNSYQLATIINGGALTTSGSQSGTHTVVNQAKRAAMATGGNTGDAVGSVQNHNIGQHRHEVPLFITPITSGGGGAIGPRSTSGSGASFGTDNDTGLRSFTDSGAPPDGGATITGVNPPPGRAETRPTNAYVNYIIKI